MGCARPRASRARLGALPYASRVHALSLLTIVLATAAGCGGAAKPSGHTDTAEGPAIHREGQEASFDWKEAAVTPGALRVVHRVGNLRTLEVLADGTARMSLTFSHVTGEVNGRPVVLSGEPAELRFMSGRSGGVSGAMSVIGEATMDEPFVASVLPLAWPPALAWPAATESGATVAVTIAGNESSMAYRRWPGAPEGLDWIGLSGEITVQRSPTGAARARVGALLATTESLDTRARVALGSAEEEGAGVEIEMRIGQDVPLPEPEPGGLLACADDVRALRTRFDEVMLPPFVLNRPIEDAMLTGDSAEGVGPGLLLDLRPTDGRAGVEGLFEGLDPAMPPAARASLAARLRDAIDGIVQSMEVVAVLTGLPTETLAGAPVYVLVPADTPARRVHAVAGALAEQGREARLVVRRPSSGPREGMLRGSLWPIAERLVERATECPFVARAVAELPTRDVMPSPGWVRAVVAGGIGTCGCNHVMAEELAREVLRWSDVALQSWGYKAIGDEAATDAPVAEVYGAGAS